MWGTEVLTGTLTEMFRALYTERNVDKALSFFADDINRYSDTVTRRYNRSSLKEAFERILSDAATQDIEMSITPDDVFEVSDEISILYAAVSLIRHGIASVVLPEKWNFAFLFKADGNGNPLICAYHALSGDADYISQLHRDSAAMSRLARLLSFNTECGILTSERTGDTFRITYVGENMHIISGYSEEELLSADDRIFTRIWPKEAFTKESLALLESGERLSLEYRLTKKDGEKIWVSAKGHAFLSGGRTQYAWIFTNIDEQKQALLSLEMERSRYTGILQMSDTITFEYDPANDILTNADTWSQQFPFPQRIMGFIEFLPEFEYLLEEDKSAVAEFICKRTPEEPTAKCEARIIDNSGEPRWYLLQCTAVFDKDDEPAMIIGTYKCIDDEKKRYQELYNRSRTDALSGLLNISAARDDIGKFIAENPKGTHALAIIDLENFGYISDYLGYTFGSVVIQNVSERIKETCTDGEIIARLGSDEFIVFSGNTTKEKAMNLSERLSHILETVYCGNLKDVTVSCKIGLAVGSEGTAYTDYFDMADRALSAARQSAGDCFRIYTSELSGFTTRLRGNDGSAESKHSIQSSVMVRETTELVFEMLSETNDLDNALNALIEKVRRRHKLSLVSIFEISPDLETVSMTYISKSESCHVRPEAYLNIPRDKFIHGNTPADEHGIYEERCHTAKLPMPVLPTEELLADNPLLACMIKDDGKFAGAVIFRSKEKDRVWTPDERCVLSTLTKIIASYLLKARVNERAVALIDKLTNYDKITGRYKLEKFKEVVRNILDASPNEEYTLFYSDITNFRSVNDLFGFSAGNNLLHHLSDMIAKSPNFICGCRDFADNFVTLCRRDRSGDPVVALREISTRFVSKYSDVTSQTNIRVKTGVFLINDTSADVTTMIDNANIARKTAKLSAHQDYFIFDDKLSLKMKRIQEIEATMVSALENGEFKVFFQPKYDLANNHIVGSEALIRWIRPDNTMFYPDEFIPQFEKNGFIEKVDTYVLEYVCRKISRELAAGLNVVPVSVNQSRFLLFDVNYVSNVIAILDKYNIPDGMLEIEITESMFFEKSRNLADIIAELKRRTNLRVSIDDFGSGYSSLNILKNLPVDTIKIDKEFLDESETSDNAKIIVGKTVELAKELGFRTVCEGVETRSQAEYLRSINCDMAQGYLYSKPIPEDAYMELLSNEEVIV